MLKKQPQPHNHFRFSGMFFASLALVLSCLNPDSTWGQEDFKFEKQVDALVQPYLDQQKFYAASIGIIKDGKVFTRGYGQLSKEDPTQPDADTIYEIGSISKVFTSLLLADAVNHKSIQLDQTIGSIAEGLEQDNPEIANGINLQQLSQHMSGLPRMPSNNSPKDPNNPFADYDRARLLEYLKQATTVSEPGQKHAYSNLGAGLLGDLLSQSAEKPLAVLLEERVFTPLKMTDSSISVAKDKFARFAPPHNASLMTDYRWDFDALAGGGAIRSTVNDMVKFMQANLEPPTREIGDAINLAWKKQLEATKDHRAMGLGWMISGDGSTRWHNGQTGGYQAMMLVNRELKTGVILLANTAGSEIDGLAESIFQLVVGIPVKPRTFAKTIEVDEKFVQRLVGKYQLAPGIVIEITANGNRMMAQITGQQALRIDPESNTEWNYKDVEAKLVFDVADGESASQVTLLQNGRTMVSPRIKEN